MGSEQIADPVVDSVEVIPSKKSNRNVPRKIHKAVREKLKRDRMNDLFLNLGKTLDLDHMNDGKASVLRETIKLLRDLPTKVEDLNKENMTLLSEFDYVTSERNELVDETSALDTQVKMLRKAIDERVNSDELAEDHVTFPDLVGHGIESTPVVGPVFVVPLHHDSQVFPGPFSEVNVPNVPSSVSRPLPRYPSSSDSWPSHILTGETNVVQDV